MIASHLSADERFAPRGRPVRGLARSWSVRRFRAHRAGHPGSARLGAGRDHTRRAAGSALWRASRDALRGPGPSEPRGCRGLPRPPRPRSPRSGSRHRARRASARSPQAVNGRELDLQPGADPSNQPSLCRLSRESATGPPSTSPCERSAGPTPFPQATWSCSRRPARNHRSGFASGPKPGAPGGRTQPCIFGNPSTLLEQESLDD